MTVEDLPTLIPAEAYEAVVERIRPLLAAAHGSWCNGASVTLTMDDRHAAAYGELEVAIRIHSVEDDNDIFTVIVGVTLNGNNVVDDNAECRTLAEAFAGELGAHTPRVVNRRFAFDVPAGAITVAA